MTTKKIYGAMLALALTFGLVLTGCENDTTDSTDSALNGTWVSVSESEQQELKLNNGSFEVSIDGQLSVKGTYTASGGKMTIKTTHLHSAMFSELGLGLEAEWYSKADLKAALVVPGGMTEEMFDQYFGESFPEYTGDYSVNGNTLVTSSDEGTETYTKK